MVGYLITATVKHFFAVIFPTVTAPKIDTIVPTVTVRVDFFFKIVEIADFEERTKDFVFVIVVQNARFFQSIKQYFGIDIIPVYRVIFDTFDILYKQFFVDTVKFKAFFFKFFYNFIPIGIVRKIKPFRA